MDRMAGTGITIRTVRTDRMAGTGITIRTVRMDRTAGTGITVRTVSGISSSTTMSLKIMPHSSRIGLLKADSATGMATTEEAVLAASTGTATAAEVSSAAEMFLL